MKKRYAFLPKTWLRFSLTASIAFAFFSNLQAQNAPAKQWDKTFGGNYNDGLTSLQQTSDGGYILGGSSASGIGGDKTQASRGYDDFWILKTDANGNKVWDKTFGGNGFDALYSLQQTEDGGYILGGYSNSIPSGDKSQPWQGDSDYWIVKLDAEGNKIWDKAFGGDKEDELVDMHQTADGGYILGGQSRSSFSGTKSDFSLGYDYWIVKLDANGNKTWDKTFGGNGFDTFAAIQQTTDGGFILGGTSSSGIGGNKTQGLKGIADYWVIKTDVNGKKVWEKTFGGNRFNLLYSLQQTEDGGYILCGASDSPISGNKTQPSQGEYDFWILKLDANGNKIWDKTYGGIGDDKPTDIWQTSDGGYILGGNSSSGFSGDKTQDLKGTNDFWVVKLDGNGNKRWDASFGANGYNSLSSLQKTADGGYILGGASLSGISGDKSQASQGAVDYWIVKLTPDGLEVKDGEAIALSVSPNPSNGKFTLLFSNLTSPTAEVTVSDLLGQVVLQKEIQITNNQLSEELTFPNAKGLYLLQLKAGEQIFTRKIVVE